MAEIAGARVLNNPAPSGIADPSGARICAAIVTYNIGQNIHRCFQSIRSQVAHVVIIDNGSDEPTVTELKRLQCSTVTLILNANNRGVAHAYNQAVHWAAETGFEWILLLDHDSEATPGMVARLAANLTALRAEGIQNIGILASNPFDVNTLHYIYYGPSVDGPKNLEEDAVISSGSMIWLGVFEHVGMFHVELFMYYVDTEFCKRLKNKGFRIFVSLDAVLLHQEGTRTRHKFLWRQAYYDHYAPAARYYLMRNAVYLLRRGVLNRHDVVRIAVRYWKEHWKILFFDKERFTVLRFSLRGLIDGLRGRMGPLPSAKAG